MKLRTIEELHDKYIGHKKFARVCDLLIADNYQITNIKEYNEQFKFKVNNREFIYRKEWKASAKVYCEYLINIFNSLERIAEAANNNNN